MTETPQDTYQRAPEAPKQGSGLAIAAFALGLCTFIPCIGLLTGLLAIILGIVVLATRRPGKGYAIAAVATPPALLLVSALLVSITLPPLNRARELAKRAICGSNLHSIGQAVVLYQGENNDEFPPTLQHLIDAGYDAKLFICPSTGHDEPFDHFYLPPAADAPGETIIACNFEANHKEVRNVLFAEARVSSMRTEEFERELATPHNAAFAAALNEAESVQSESENPQ